MPIELQPEKTNRRSDVMAKALTMTFLRSVDITVIRKVTTLRIISSQKTSNSFNNLHIGDCL